MSQGDHKHIEANTMAALVEHRLPRNEEMLAFNHLSKCALCRDWLALNVPQSRKSTILSWPRKCAMLVAAMLLMAVSIAKWNAERFQFIARSAGVWASMSRGPSSIEKPIIQREPSRLPVSRTADLTKFISLDPSFVPRSGSTMQLPAVWNHAKLTRNPILSQDKHLAANRIVLMTALGERWISIDDGHYLR